MTGSGSPCGACKFLRRKCAKGCVFAPYFCHEQGAAHFAAIHKVFGASNASKLLARLPVSDRCGAAVTISYEAQARLQDPIYGCVSYIFALQQQVVNLQARLAFLKELQFANSCANPQDVQNWFLSETSSNPIPELDPSFAGNFGHIPYCENGSLLVDDPNPIGSFENPIIPEENVSFSIFQEANSQHYPVDSNSVHMQTSSSRWLFRDDADELGSVAFGKIQH